VRGRYDRVESINWFAAPRFFGLLAFFLGVKIEGLLQLRKRYCY
jgi:hypothetical protein